MTSILDYSKWDFSGQGKNIFPFLTEEERAVWFAALPFQDKRKDLGQGEVVTYFALLLLRHISAKREIVIPAAILHDTGWSKIENADKIHRDKVKNGTVNTVEYRMIHQKKGVEIAQEILSALNFQTAQERKLIYDIIGDHDTRTHEPTIEGRIMMDADILWRFTVPHRNAYLQNETVLDLITIMKKEMQKLNRFYTSEALEIANKEITNTIRWCFPQNHEELLGAKEKIIRERIMGNITKREELSQWGHARFIEKEACIKIDNRKEKIVKRASIEAPNGANILPYFFRGDRCCIVLVAQFRTAVEAVTWEAPGGVIEAVEQDGIRLTMARELREEAGIIINAKDVEVVFKEYLLPSLTCGLGWGGLIQIKEKDISPNRINGEPQEGEFTSLIVKSLAEIIDMRKNQKIIFDLWTSRLIDEVTKRVGIPF